MLHIAYIFPKSLYETKMSPGRRMYGDAVDRLEDVKVTVTGPGWDDWASDDITKSLPSIEKKHGDVDTIWAYKSDAVSGIDKLGKPVFTVFNEANDEAKTEKDLAATKANHCVFHHYGDHVRWSNELADRGISASLQNHCSPYNPFADEMDWDKKQNDCLLTGAVSLYVYPLRVKYQTGLRSKEINGYAIPHPGYRIGGSQQIRSQYESYMMQLSRARISLCCTSRYKYPLAKLFESAASGCVICTDKPECPIFEQSIWPYCIQIDPDWEVDRIAEEIKSYNENALYDMAFHTLRMAREVFTMEGWARKFTATIRKKLND